MTFCDTTAEMLHTRISDQISAVVPPSGSILIFKLNTQLICMSARFGKFYHYFMKNAKNCLEAEAVKVAIWMESP